MAEGACRTDPYFGDSALNSLIANETFTSPLSIKCTVTGIDTLAKIADGHPINRIGELMPWRCVADDDQRVTG